MNYDEDDEFKQRFGSEFLQSDMSSEYNKTGIDSSVYSKNSYKLLNLN